MVVGGFWTYTSFLRSIPVTPLKHFAGKMLNHARVFAERWPGVQAAFAGEPHVALLGI